MKKYQKAVVAALSATVLTVFLAAKVGTSAGADASTDGRSARPALSVTAISPVKEMWPEQISANGSVYAWEEAVIGSESQGLRIVEVLVNIGDKVKKGQVLAKFYSESVQADLAHAVALHEEARASHGEASANAERARSLANVGALSAQQIQQMVTAEETAKARAAAHQAVANIQRIRLAHTHVISPDEGLISARSATVGSVPPPGQELFRLIRGGRLEWRAEVTPEEASAIKKGAAATLLDSDGNEVKGVVRTVSPTVGERTRSTVVFVDLPQTESLKPGFYTRGKFLLGETYAIAIPQQAVVIRDGFSYVYKIDAAGKVAQIPVKIGRRKDRKVEVVEGLSATDKIVASGAAFLSDGDQVMLLASSEDSIAR